MPDTPIVRRLRRLVAEAQKALEAAEALPAPGRPPPGTPTAPAGCGRLFTPLDLARGMIGVMEAAGEADNPQVVAFLRAWPPRGHRRRGAVVLGVRVVCCQVAGFERSRSLRARSWLDVGAEVRGPADARPGDVAVFSRGRLPQPGPEVRQAPGTSRSWPRRRGRARSASRSSAGTRATACPRCGTRRAGCSASVGCIWAIPAANRCGTSATVRSKISANRTSDARLLAVILPGSRAGKSGGSIQAAA